jgi:hypothetical protein
MLNGIKEEILSINQQYAETFKKETTKEQAVLAGNLINKIQTFLDFLYRDNNQLFNKLQDEAEEVKQKDKLLETEYNKNMVVEISELYIDFCLSPSYKYRGEVFNSIFYGDVL